MTTRSSTVPHGPLGPDFAAPVPYDPPGDSVAAPAGVLLRRQEEHTMRMRWLALGGGTGWLALVVVVGLVSDLEAASAVLFAALGLMMVAGLVFVLSIPPRITSATGQVLRASPP